MTPAWHTLSAPERMQMVEEASPRGEHPLVSLGLWVAIVAAAVLIVRIFA